MITSFSVLFVRLVVEDVFDECFATHIHECMFLYGHCH